MSYERCDGCGTSVDVGQMIYYVRSNKLYHWCCVPDNFNCDAAAYYSAMQAIEAARRPPTPEAP